MTRMYIQDRLCKVTPINMQRCKCQIFVPRLWPCHDASYVRTARSLYFRFKETIILRHTYVSDSGYRHRSFFFRDLSDLSRLLKRR